MKYSVPRIALLVFLIIVLLSAVIGEQSFLALLVLAAAAWPIYRVIRPASGGNHMLVQEFERWLRGTPTAALNLMPTQAQPLPAPGQPRDPETAQKALVLAHAYLSEVVDAKQQMADADHAARHRSTLALAARQLAIAQAADPSVELSVPEQDGTSLTFTQTSLRSYALVLEAQTYMDTNLDYAVALAERATQVDPSSHLAHHLLGGLCFEAHDRTRALAALETAHRLEPNNIETIKLLDRARNMGDAEIAAYHVTKGVTGFWKYARWIIIPYFYIIYVVLRAMFRSLLRAH